MRLLVTGSSGQIGSYTVEAARAAGWDVRGLDLRQSRWTSNVGDVRRAEDCQKALERVDTVIHLAAHISVPESVQDPVADAEHNVLGTVRMIEAARRADVHRFIFASSAAVYGSPASVPVKETQPPSPLSPYGAAKLAGEGYTGLLRSLYKIEGIIVRPFNVYSPRQDPRNPYSGVMSLFAERVARGRAPTVFGDGAQTRDFIHATDVAAALVRLADPNVMPGPAPINLGTGTATKIGDLAKLFMDLGAVRGLPEKEDPRPGDVLHSVADTARMAGLGMSPKKHLRAGVTEMIASMR